MFAFHEATSTTLNAPVEAAFSFLDDFSKLSGHMQRASAMMLGSRMTIETDAGGGQAIGSRVRMRGKVLGLTLALEEVVTERQPPWRKCWQTIDAKLVVIGQYRLGYELGRRGSTSLLRVAIDYDLPAKTPARWLGLLFARRYARWCIERMMSDAVRAFGKAPG